MKKIILSLIISVLPCVANAYIDKTNAVVRILNKDAGKVTEHTIAVGQGIKFEKLNIDVRTCKQSDPFDAEDYFAFVEIFDGKNQVFGGWMTKNDPGKNPLQHPDYDVWLVKCE
ncbi:MAG: DUF2155 domain-containing protein [Alphaproteobacteria bacterium]|nr:DUF2155 domain-containing protein [Alphaproteobacteria bacterium]